MSHFRYRFAIRVKRRFSYTWYLSCWIIRDLLSLLQGVSSPKLVVPTDTPVFPYMPGATNLPVSEPEAEFVMSAQNTVVALHSAAEVKHHQHESMAVSGEQKRPSEQSEMSQQSQGNKSEQSNQSNQSAQTHQSSQNNKSKQNHQSKHNSPKFYKHQRNQSSQSSQSSQPISSHSSEDTGEVLTQTPLVVPYGMPVIPFSPPYVSPEMGSSYPQGIIMSPGANAMSISAGVNGMMGPQGMANAIYPLPGIGSPMMVEPGMDLSQGYPQYVNGIGMVYFFPFQQRNPDNSSAAESTNEHM